jgi:hypothetical protein
VWTPQLDQGYLAFEMDRKRKNRRKGRRNQPRNNGFRMSSTTVLLSESVSIIGSSAVTPFLWGGFAGFTALADYFHYFKPLSYRIEFP